MVKWVIMIIIIASKLSLNDILVNQNILIIDDINNVQRDEGKPELCRLCSSIFRPQMVLVVLTRIKANG